jgi:hypothetical protein
MIIGASGGGSTTSTNQTKNIEVAKKVEVTKITSSALMKAYTDNEVNADNLYKGKHIEITDVVQSIGKDIMDNAYITFAGNSNTFGDIQCMFPKTAESEIGLLKKGQTITIQGDVSGKLGNIIVENCTILK